MAKRKRSTVGAIAYDNLALPAVRQVLVPALARKALLDHDLGVGTPGVPSEVKVTLREDGLKESAEILRDQYGVPSIYAQNDEDLFFLQGRCHVEDRLFQMEMTRRLASGRISEFAGERALSIDKFARTMGWERLAADELAALTKASRKKRGGEKEAEVLRMIESYVSGINSTIADLSSKGKLPFEFVLGKIDVSTPWEPQDVLAVMHVMAFKLSFGFQGPIIKHALSLVLGDEVANSWFQGSGPDCPETSTSQFHPNASELIRKMAVFDFGLSEIIREGQGSNAWCIDPEHTADGVGALLANDPHLDTGIPTFFYETHLCSARGRHGAEGLHFTGMTVPGIPGLVLPGHNDHVCWGVTLSMCDVEDVYVEMVNREEGYYVANRDQYRDLETFDHEIRVKSLSEPVKCASAWTQHGPIISDLGHDMQVGMDGLMGAIAEGDVAPPDGADFELSYAARHLQNDLHKNLLVFVDILRSKNCMEARELYSRLISPSLNICLADRDGNIAYQTSGEVPQRLTPPGFESYPLCGWTGEAGWAGMIKGDDLPSEFNPESGRLVTANHKIVDNEATGYPHYLGNLWQDGYRAESIFNMIDGKIWRDEKISANDCAKMQGCCRSSAGLDFVQEAVAVKGLKGTPKKAMAELAKWNGDLAADSVGALIYKSCFQFFLNNMLQKMFPKIPLMEFDGQTEDDGHAQGVVAEFLKTVPDSEERSFFLKALAGHGFNVVLKAFNECKSILHGNAFSVLKGRQSIGDRYDRKKVLRDSVIEAVEWLERKMGADMSQWRWGKLHKLKLLHPLAEKLKMDALNMEIEFGGDSTTPNQATYNASLVDGEPDFTVVKSTGAVSACRVVMIPSDWDKSGSVVTGGQSGKYRSRHYGDQLSLFKDTELKPMLWTRERVEEACVFKTNIEKVG